jgi:hypothetical protein
VPPGVPQPRRLIADYGVRGFKIHPGTQAFFPNDRLAYPSFPWQDVALSIAIHKPRVYIDLSGWSPKYFSPTLVQYAGSLLKHKVLFGTDFPVLTPERWMADFENLSIKPDVRPLIMKENAAGCSASARTRRRTRLVCLSMRAVDAGSFQDNPLAGKFPPGEGSDLTTEGNLRPRRHGRSGAETASTGGSSR